LKQGVRWYSVHGTPQSLVSLQTQTLIKSTTYVIETVLSIKNDSLIREHLSGILHRNQISAFISQFYSALHLYKNIFRFFNTYQ
jgi:hypothetical protein